LSEDLSQIVEFETIDSTSTEAHRRAAAGARGPLWIRSDRQEQGRGRSGRPWSSPPGNLSATYMFTPDCERAVFHQLSFVAGIAGYDAVAAGLENTEALQLKWPNDLMIKNAKVGGILVESSKYADDIVVMIGIGINITVTPEVDGRMVTRLADHGPAPTPQLLLQRLRGAMSGWLSVWDGGVGFASIRAAWLARAHPTGQPLTVNAASHQHVGTFAGMADNGALLLALPTNETIRIEHGDVALASAITLPEERA
jgi:BirA family biotin operon repressor/biotin-[acetyl-CoA-carboxylase] ligase